MSISSAYALVPCPMYFSNFSLFIYGFWFIQFSLIFSISISRSLMYIRNRNGESIPPYGTPFSTLTDASPVFILHCVRYHWTAFFQCMFLCGNLLIFSINIQWSTESNAYLKSINRKPACL